MKALLLAAAALAAIPAWAGTRQDAKTVLEEDPARRKGQEEWGYSAAIVSDGTVYLSGVVAGLREGETDLEASYERAFQRIGVILAQAGASWDDVVDITSFHTDVSAQMPAIVAVKNRYVKAPFPAWTAIQVSRLIPPNGITEIKVVARLPKVIVR